MWSHQGLKLGKILPNIVDLQGRNTFHWICPSQNVLYLYNNRIEKIEHLKAILFNFSLHKYKFVSFFVIKLGHFTEKNTFFSICNKRSSLISKTGKRRKTKFNMINSWRPCHNFKCCTCKKIKSRRSKICPTSKNFENCICRTIESAS